MKWWILPAIVVAATASRASASALWHDLRIVFETTQVDLASLDAATGDWGVVSVTTAVMGRLEAPNEDAVPFAKAPAPTADAEWIPAYAEAIATLHGEMPEGCWRCFVPVPPRRPFHTPPMMWMDRSPGTCVTRVTDGAPGMGRPVLLQTKLIPGSWATQVRPALAAWRNNRNLFLGKAFPHRREALTILVKDPNPMLACAAAQALARSEELPPEAFSDADLAAKDERTVLIDCFLLTQAAVGPRERSVARLGRLIDASRSQEDLHGIALASALALEIAGAKRHEDDMPGYRVLARVEDQAAKLSADHKLDTYIDDAGTHKRLIRRLLDRIEHRRPQSPVEGD